MSQRERLARDVPAVCPCCGANFLSQPIGSGRWTRRCLECRLRCLVSQHSWVLRPSLPASLPDRTPRQLR